MQAKPLIAVQGAMDGEIIVFLEAMKTYREEKWGTYSFFVGEIETIPVVVSRTEIGMVNAAAATTLLIDKYQPDMIINQGTAGGHDPHLRVFDTIVGKEVLPIHSFVSSHLDKGQGMAPETWVPMETSIRETSGTLATLTVLESDPTLVKIALEAAREYPYGKVVEGRVGTADFWNREIDRIHWFHTHFQTSAEEMEAYAVAQIAHAFSVPFLSIRTISNSEVTEDEIEDLGTAGRYCAEFTLLVAKAIYNQTLFQKTN